MGGAWEDVRGCGGVLEGDVNGEGEVGWEIMRESVREKNRKWEKKTNDLM